MYRSVIIPAKDGENEGHNNGMVEKVSLQMSETRPPSSPTIPFKDPKNPQSTISRQKKAASREGQGVRNTKAEQKKTHNAVQE